MLEYLQSKTGMIDRQIASFLPRELDEEWLRNNIGGIRYKLRANVYKDLLLPAWDLLERGGKRWRPVLMMLSCDAVKGGSIVHDFIPLIELVHNGTLIIDDIEDDSTIRRKQPAIHKKYGIDVAVNLGNMLYFLPSVIIRNSKLEKNTKLLLYQAWSEELLKLHLGQGLDITWHNSDECPSEAAYLQMCAFKTGVLARLAAKTGAIIGRAKPKQVNALGRFAESIGIAFQIQDDILNLRQDALGKEFGDDISEGKKSLMVVHVMSVGEEEDKQELQRILSMGTREHCHVKKAIGIMDKYDSIGYSKKRATEIMQSAWNQLDYAIEESESKKRLHDFAKFLIERDI